MYKLALSPSHDKVEKCLHSRETRFYEIAFSLANKLVFYTHCRENYDDPRASFIINQVFLSRTVNSNSVVATAIAYRNRRYKSSRFRNTAIQRDDPGIFMRVTGHATHV